MLLASFHRLRMMSVETITGTLRVLSAYLLKRTVILPLVTSFAVIHVVQFLWARKACRDKMKQRRSKAAQRKAAVEERISHVVIFFFNFTSRRALNILWIYITWSYFWSSYFGHSVKRVCMWKRGGGNEAKFSLNCNPEILICRQGL